MLTTINLDVTIEAETPEAAYDELCGLLNLRNENMEYYTHHYFTSENDGAEVKDTQELFP